MVFPVIVYNWTQSCVVFRICRPPSLIVLFISDNKITKKMYTGILKSTSLSSLAEIYYFDKIADEIVNIFLFPWRILLARLMESMFIIVNYNSNANYNASWSVHNNEILLELMHFRDKPNKKTSCEFLYEISRMI
jgi:hypothetical protein